MCAKLKQMIYKQDWELGYWDLHNIMLFFIIFFLKLYEENSHFFVSDHDVHFHGHLLVLGI